MADLKKYLLYILGMIASVISYIPASLYSYVYSEFFTKATYKQIGERNKDRKNVKNLLDIGTATGGPLKTIVGYFQQAQILGIDYNKHYIPACKKLFKDHANVQIREMDFYNLEKEEPNTFYDVIIFGSSFMILPDQVKALQIAKRKLARDGKIYFLLTLFEERTLFTRISEFVKPLLKYICTIDFGKVIYVDQFEGFMKEHGVVKTFSERCHGNFFLKLAKFYIYEFQKCQ